MTEILHLYVAGVLAGAFAGAFAAFAILGHLSRYDKIATITTGEFMFIVKDDHPDTEFAVADFKVTDAEGNEVEAKDLRVTVESDNPAAVAVTMNDTRTGLIQFGSPGDANLTAKVSSADGRLLGAFGAQFHVTAGDPAAITGGTISFKGLSEATPTPAAS